MDNVDILISFIKSKLNILSLGIAIDTIELDLTIHKLLFDDLGKIININKWNKLSKAIRPTFNCEKHAILLIGKEIYFTKNDNLIYTFNLNATLKEIEQLERKCNG